MPSYSGSVNLGSVSGVTGTLTLNVWENSTSTEGNYSNCGANLVLNISSGYWSAGSTGWSVWGSASGSGGTGYVSYSAGSYELWSANFNVGHDANGDGSVSLGATFDSSYVFSGTTYAGGALTHINRYFTKTPKIEENSKTTTSIEIKWSTSENCNRVRYKLDNGSWIDAFTGNTKSGTFTIPNLASNSDHSVVAECRRADSNLTSNSNTLTVSTSNKTGHIKIDGEEKEATPYIYVNNEWKVMVPHIRVNGNWERSK